MIADSNADLDRFFQRRGSWFVLTEQVFTCTPANLDYSGHFMRRIMPCRLIITSDDSLALEVDLMRSLVVCLSMIWARICNLRSESNWQHLDIRATESYLSSEIEVNFSLPGPSRKIKYSWIPEEKMYSFARGRTWSSNGTFNIVTYLQLGPL